MLKLLVVLKGELQFLDIVLYLNEARKLSWSLERLAQSGLGPASV